MRWVASLLHQFAKMMKVFHSVSSILDLPVSVASPKRRHLSTAKARATLSKMNSGRFEIRAAHRADVPRILDLHRSAFGEEEGEVLAKLVAEMLEDPSADPTYSFVATQGDETVGHALFTAVRIEPNVNASAQILAPLAVSREHQGAGIGTLLVESALADLQSNDVELIFVLGYPDYYSRFGFTPAGVLGLQAPYPIAPKNADAWMVKQFRSGTVQRCQGTVQCCDSLDDPQFWQE